MIEVLDSETSFNLYIKCFGLMKITYVIFSFIIFKDVEILDFKISNKTYNFIFKCQMCSVFEHIKIIFNISFIYSYTIF